MEVQPLSHMKTGWIKVNFSIFVLLSLLNISSSASADETLWLPEGSRMSSTKTIPEFLEDGTRLKGDVLLGKLLFNSPTLLGEKAVRVGLTCNSCHPNGHKNTLFFIPELSSFPGTVDLTSRFWHDAGEDNLFNPIPIPTLRNIKNSAPYGSDNKVPSLQQFTKNVIVKEFGGPIPKPNHLNALLQYLSVFSEEKTAQSPPNKLPSVYNLLFLLKDPLLLEDQDELGIRIGLIKEELARQLSESNRETQISLAKSLRELGTKAKSDRKSALRFLSELSDRFRDQ